MKAIVRSGFRMHAGGLITTLVLGTRRCFAISSFSARSRSRFDIDVPGSRQAFGIVATKELDQALAQFAAEIEGFTGIGGAD